MEINENLEILNTFLSKRRIGFADKLHILDLARISKSIDELKENIQWESNSQI